MTNRPSFLLALALAMALTAALGAQRAPLLQPGKQTLHQRVLTRPGAQLLAAPGGDNGKLPRNQALRQSLWSERSPTAARTRGCSLSSRLGSSTSTAIFISCRSWPREGDDSSTGLRAEELRSAVEAKGVGLFVLHLKTPQGNGSHAVAETQYRTLAANPAIQDSLTVRENLGINRRLLGLRRLDARVMSAADGAAAGACFEAPPG